MVLAVVIGTMPTMLSAAVTGQIPQIGDRAPAFALNGLDGTPVSLSGELAHGPVVLIMLRGWPGYQCPFCTRQFGDFLSHAKELEAAGARVVWVYPGPPDQVQQRAQEFTANKQLPGNFRFATDPDYGFTKTYGLRWEAKGETSYPSTFVIDATGTVRFAQISRAHDGRASAADVLKALAALSH
ncbi:MAG TPA: peroxiredoxin family protein [Vicinamibacterales bacterium]